MSDVVSSSVETCLVIGLSLICVEFEWSGSADNLVNGPYEGTWRGSPPAIETGVDALDTAPVLTWDFPPWVRVEVTPGGGRPASPTMGGFSPRSPRSPHGGLAHAPLSLSKPLLERPDGFPALAGDAWSGILANALDTPSPPPEQSQALAAAAVVATEPPLALLVQPKVGLLKSGSVGAVGTPFNSTMHGSKSTQSLPSSKLCES